MNANYSITSAVTIGLLETLFQIEFRVAWDFQPVPAASVISLQLILSTPALIHHTPSV
jgi:hypothetical protein